MVTNHTSIVELGESHPQALFLNIEMYTWVTILYHTLFILTVAFDKRSWSFKIHKTGQETGKSDKLNKNFEFF